MTNLKYLQNLNNSQKEAVLYTSGPLLIVAGAGSGKTRVLTSRIAHILKNNKAFLMKYYQSHLLTKLLERCRIESVKY